MKAVRLKHLVGVNERVLPEWTSPDRSFAYVDISSVGRGVLVEQPAWVRFGDAPSRARRVLTEGDVLVSTVRTYLRAVWRPRVDTRDLIASTGFAVLTPRQGIDARFLGWLVESDSFIEEVVARSTGVSYPAIAPADLADIAVHLPSLDEQRAIADFLDAETARIDALVRLRRVGVRLAEERLLAEIDAAILSRGAPVERLRHAAGGVTVGVVVNPSTYVSGAGDVPFFRGVDVSRFHLNMSSAERISRASNHQLTKSILRSGDVVSIRVGDPGVSAVVPSEADGSNCASLMITRSSPRADGRYLSYVFNSNFGRGQFRALSVGAAQRQINITAAADLLVPLPELGEQIMIADRLDVTRRRVSELAARSSDQSGLLLEHRQALVTAAVTGQIDVSTASGRGVA